MFAIKKKNRAKVTEVESTGRYFGAVICMPVFLQVFNLLQSTVDERPKVGTNTRGTE